MTPEARGFSIRYSHARFVDEPTLEVGGEQLTVLAYFVATGVAPHVPDCRACKAEHLTSTRRRWS